jgi:hypothetical protein
MDAPLAALMAQLVMSAQQPGGLQMGPQGGMNAAQMRPAPGIQQPPGVGQANPGLTGSGGPADPSGAVAPRFMPPTRMPPARPPGM